MVVLTKHSKTHFSEAEAAESLGVSVDRLRSMIRNYIAPGDEEMNNVPQTTFQQSDLLLLRLLSGMRARQSGA